MRFVCMSFNLKVLGHSTLLHQTWFRWFFKDYNFFGINLFFKSLISLAYQSPPTYGPTSAVPYSPQRAQPSTVNHAEYQRRTQYDASPASSSYQRIRIIPYVDSLPAFYKFYAEKKHDKLNTLWTCQRCPNIPMEYSFDLNPPCKTNVGNCPPPSHTFETLFAV